MKTAAQVLQELENPSSGVQCYNNGTWVSRHNPAFA
jgi:hypothetical protein